MKFDESVNAFVLHDHLDLTEINLSALAEINYGWDLWQHQQSKVDELQRRNQMLNDNIKEQGQKLVYQNEVIETQAEKLLGLRDEKAELQKRVDDLTQVMEELLEEMKYPTATFEEVICSGVIELEKALKGGIK